MVNYSTTEFLNIQARLDAGRKKPVSGAGQAERETGRDGVQRAIMDWCDSQWPAWAYDFPRTDLKSTLPLGRHDATVWGPFPKCFLIETKAKHRKLSSDQRIWIKKLEMLGWKVHVIYSLDEFKKVVGLK